MSADLQQGADPSHHIAVVVLGKVFLACLGLAIGLFAGLIIALLTGLMQISC